MERELHGDRQRASNDSAGQGTCHVLKSHTVRGCLSASLILSILPFTLCFITQNESEITNPTSLDFERMDQLTLKCQTVETTSPQDTTPFSAPSSLFFFHKSGVVKQDNLRHVGGTEECR